MPPLTPHWTTRPKVLDRHALWRNLALPGLAQFKPGLVHWACSGQAQAALDGARGLVYPTPKGLNGRQKSRSMPARVPSQTFLALASKTVTDPSGRSASHLPKEEIHVRVFLFGSVWCRFWGPAPCAHELHSYCNLLLGHSFMLLHFSVPRGQRRPPWPR